MKGKGREGIEREGRGLGKGEGERAGEKWGKRRGGNGERKRRRRCV